MKKMMLTLCLLMLGLLFLTRPVSANLTWYWGSDPNSDYTASYNLGEWWIPLPFTLEAAGEEVAGAGGPEIIYTGSASSGWRFDFNMGSYWGIYTGTALIPNGFALAVDGVPVLPEGSYSINLNTPYWGINYWPDPTSKINLLQVRSLNNFVIQVGQSTPSPVPEPSTMLLLGSGLLGLVALRRKVKK